MTGRGAVILESCNSATKYVEDTNLKNTIYMKDCLLKTDSSVKVIDSIIWNITPLNTKITLLS